MTTVSAIASTSTKDKQVSGLVSVASVNLIYAKPHKTTKPTSSGSGKSGDKHKRKGKLDWIACDVCDEWVCKNMYLHVFLKGKIDSVCSVQI